MKRFSILLFAIFFSFLTLAQGGSKVVQTIQGKVINAATNQPVSYTNIGLEDTYYGTASDAEGNFELKIPEELVDKNIYFSAVGFKNKQLPVKSLFNKEFNVIKLEEQSYGVGEVDVAAQNMVLIRILRMASENIKYNFGTGPFNLHCNYTNEIIVNSEKNVAVANVLIYDESGYSNPSKLDAYQKRKYTVTKEKGKDDYSFATGIINIDEILGFDLARSASSVLNPALLNEFQLSLADQPTLDGKEYWVISFSQVLPSLEGSGDFNASKFEGQITIKKEDYSVLKITGKVKSAKNNRQGRGLAVGDSNTNYFENVTYEFAVDYTNLLVNEIHLKKAYTYKQKSIEEQTILTVNRAHANNLTKIDTRDYFQGE